MKAIIVFCLAWLAGMSLVLSVSAEQFRTDINPALEYYQAFLLAPNLEQADREMLDTNGVPDHQLPERFGEIIAKYDGQFDSLRRAARATVPCDWGIDLSAGTATVLPHLARAKAVVQTARLRAMWDLQQRRPSDACEDSLAALALGRNVAHPDLIISVLVQMAIEAIVCTSVAENFGRYPPETLQRFLEGFDAAPKRGTIASCIPAEKTFFHDQTVNKILELRRQNPVDENAVMEGIHQLLAPDREVEGVVTADNSNEQRARWERLKRAAGGNSDGMLKLLRDRERYFRQMEEFMDLPYLEYQARIQQFTNQIENAANPFVSESVRALLRARSREFRILATLEMVRAAVEYKLHGEAGLHKVSDPCGKGPFSFRRFVLNGVDRGFELKSAYNLDGDDSGALIFVEKEGPAFHVSGRQIGKGLSKESAEEIFRRRYGLDRK